jgi:hypothetical protein
MVASGLSEDGSGLPRAWFLGGELGLRINLIFLGNRDLNFYCFYYIILLQSE